MGKTEIVGNLFKKFGSADQIAFEVASLAWLRDAPKGTHVVPVLESGEGWLEEPRLVSTSPTAAQAEEFGRNLARTHAAGADWFGQAPAGYSGEGRIGTAPLPLLDSDLYGTSWGAFFAAERIGPYLSAFPPAERRTLESLCAKLNSGALDHAQPALVKAGAARTHGDLWGGNVMWTARGGVLIDAAASGGHAESDLAALALFGVPHLGSILTGYNQESALAKGWRGRVGLHQLHLLAVHAFLFGGGYVSQTVDVARRYLL